MKSQLREQLDRVLDESGGQRVEAIVRMGVDRDRMQSVLNASCDAMQHRRLVASARDLVPPRANQLAARKGQAARTYTGLASLTAQVARRVELAVRRSTLKRLMSSSLRPLLSSFSGAASGLASQKATKGSKATKTAQEPGTSVRAFWSSASAAVSMTKDELRRMLEGLDGVEAVSINRTLRLMPFFETQSVPVAVDENKTSAWGVERIGALATWGAYGAYGAGTRVAVLDTGVDGAHPDLAGKVTKWQRFTSVGTPTNPPASVDTHKHGTHVAGTIAGGDASGRWIGVAPDAEIYAGTVLPGGSGTDAQILAGIDWAINEGADVINLSLGGLSFDAAVGPTYTNAIISANQVGIPVAIAMGNDGHQTTGSPGSDFFSFTVGATDISDTVAGFSAGRTQIVWQNPYIDPTYLPLVFQKPEVSAPGVDVYSSVPGGGYATWNGTSMATPHVAGALALLLSATSIDGVQAHLRAYTLQDFLTSSVRELGEAGQDQRYGFGRIDVLRATGFAWDAGYTL